MAAWLTVESALALTQADLEMIPREAAEAIARQCSIERLDLDRIREGIARTSHPLMPLIIELSRVVGEPHGGRVHWGATTQNITETGDVLVLRKVHRVILLFLGLIMTALADLAERSAQMVMAGRTHRQHAVPVTFGLKVASWIDELGRQVSRLRELEPRLFVAVVGGAAGTFASMGARAFEVQNGVAKRLGLVPMPVPSRRTGVWTECPELSPRDPGTTNASKRKLRGKLSAILPPWIADKCDEEELPSGRQLLTSFRCSNGGSFPARKRIPRWNE
jgi:adenylosuccinate lyase